MEFTYRYLSTHLWNNSSDPRKNVKNWNFDEQGIIVHSIDLNRKRTRHKVAIYFESSRFIDSMFENESISGTPIIIRIVVSIPFWCCCWFDGLVHYTAAMSKAHLTALHFTIGESGLSNTCFRSFFLFVCTKLNFVIFNL